MSDQAEELRHRLQSIKESRSAKTISIVSGKGGVGKSNFALNFALALIRNHKKVILIDLDVGMGNINILLGQHVEYTIIDMLNDSLPIRSVINKGPNNLDFISGGSGVAGLFIMNDEKKTFFMEQYCKLINDYDYIIFDMGAGATTDSIFFVLSSEECVVITTPEPTSITDSYSMIKHIINYQPNMPIYVVMNRCDSDKSGKKSLNKFKEVIQKFLNITIVPLGLIPDDKFVNIAVMKQQPYILLNDKAAVSKAVTLISEHYLRGNRLSEKPNPSTFVQKLSKFLKVR